MRDGKLKPIRIWPSLVLPPEATVDGIVVAHHGFLTVLALACALCHRCRTEVLAAGNTSPMALSGLPEQPCVIAGGEPRRPYHAVPTPNGTLRAEKCIAATFWWAVEEARGRGML